RETHISGDIVRAGDAVTVSVREGAAAHVTLTGPTSDVDGLIGRAADAIYRQTQPYRWGVLLYDADRFDEAEETFRAVSAQGDPIERAWGYNGWGSNFNYRGDPRTAERKLRQGLALDPGNPVLHLNLVGSLERIGRDGEAFAERATTIRLFLDRNPHGVSLAFREGQRLFFEGQQAQEMGDQASARMRFRAALAAPRFRQSAQVAG